MSSDGLSEVYDVPPDKTSWLRNTLADVRPVSLAILLGATALASVAVSEPASAQAPQKQPNILVIMGDDVGWLNIGAYHRGMMSGKTPNLDKLASQGMMFTDY